MYIGAGRGLGLARWSLSHARLLLQVHMLVPLVDLLDHGGDLARLRPCDPADPTDHVEWNLVGPDSAAR